MKKGYTIAIVCLLLALCVLGGLIYFDLFHGEEKAQEPVDIAAFEQAVQDIENSRTIGGHLWILKEEDYSPTLFRYTNTPTFTAEILKENKAALLHTTLKTEYLTLTGYYELYYKNGWKVELTDGKPVMIVEKTTYHYERMSSVEVVFGPADKNIAPTAAQLEAAKTIIEKRLVANHITDYETNIDVAKGYIHLRFPWADTSSAGTQKILSELTVNSNLLMYAGEGTTNSNGENIPPINGTLVLDGQDLLSATAMVNQDSATTGSSPYVIALKMTEAGAEKFSTITKLLAPNQGKISIWLDFGAAWAERNNQPRYALLSSPTVESHITGGETRITGFAEYGEAKEIADLITAGALPFEMVDRSVDILPAFSVPLAK